MYSSAGIQSYITNFQNLIARAGTKDSITLIDQFSLGLDQQLVLMILSMATIPTTIDDWIDKSKTFHAQKMHIEAIKEDTTLCPSSPPDLPPLLDACVKTNASDAERLIIVPTNAVLEETFPLPVPRTVPTTPPTPAPSVAISAIDAYVRTLTTLGKSEVEVLQTLKMCYEEPVEEVAVTTTEETSDF
ncbi:hypothetical protein OG21DRAFT_1483235 [Imleria badia]|nr:hypothetical protein OG21DRAFT_1483235 [Imleria badia]